MLDKKVTELLNQQINREFYSAYFYLDIANYYESMNLDGFANWFKIQAQEERDHAMLMYQYLHNNNAKVTLDAVSKPEKVFSDKVSPLKATLEHEIFVTSLINSIYTAAFEKKDFRTMQFLDWFVKEQGEEEKSAMDLIAKMELLGDSANSLYLLNSELRARTYNPPSLVL